MVRGKKIFEELKAGGSRNKLLIKNFSYLSFLRLFNLILPLVSYPYLVRVLGSEKYGAVVFSQSVISYFSIFINFGFNISATKDVSIHRDSKGKVNEIFSAVFILKNTLFCISVVLLFILIRSIPELGEYSSLYLFSIGIIYNEVLFPVWYFQGIEKMRYITLVNVLSRTLFTISIFFVISNEKDFIYVPLLNSLGSLLGGVFSLFIVFYNENLRLVVLSWGKIFLYFRNSLPFFLSRISVVFNLKTNILLIGHFVGFNEVAFYDLGVKISELLKTPYSILNQTIYPNIAKYKNMNLVKKILFFTIVTSILLYFVVLLFLKDIILFLGGSDMLPSKFIIMILNITIPISAISYFLGNTTLVVMDKIREFNFSVIYGTVFYLMLVFLLYMFNMINVYIISWVVVVTESFIMLFRLYFIKKHKFF